MMKPVSLSHVVRWFTKRTKISDLLTNQANKRAGLFLALSLFLISMLFTACSGLFGGAAKPTPTSSTRALSKIGWCAKPLMVFRDEGFFTPTPAGTAPAKATGTATPPASATSTTTPAATTTPTVGFGTPQTLTSWSAVKAYLGFTVFLPTTLPNGTCLVSAQATVHDSIFGSSFTIGYLLPNHTSLSVSEAPLLSQSAAFQCSGTPVPTTNKNKGTATTVTPSPTTIPTPVCSGAKSTTSIVISGPGTVAQVQQIFTNLQPNVDWIPAS